MWGRGYRVTSSRCKECFLYIDDVCTYLYSVEHLPTSRYTYVHTSVCVRMITVNRIVVHCGSYNRMTYIPTLHTFDVITIYWCEHI